MRYSIVDNGIVVEKDEFFNPYDTVTCGQIFRYKIEDGLVTIYSADKKCVIEEQNDKYFIHTNDQKYFINFLDFDRNYGIIYTKLIDKGLIVQCCDYAKGIRILNQCAVEMIISFIISANNNIPRIQKIIERLCESLGENKGDYYAFPTIEKLASVDADFYKSIGAGYRAEYLVDTAKRLLDMDINYLYSLDTNSLLAELLRLKGVGPKVADCIALFGFHKEDVFPVDTWIMKMYNAMFSQSNNPKAVRVDLTNRFQDLSGYAQQYLFFYQRMVDKKNR